MSKRSNLKEAVKFINKEGGINYYENLDVDSLSDFEVFKEMNEIQSLLKTWLDEFNWDSKEDLSFIKRILYMPSVKISKLLETFLSNENSLIEYLEDNKHITYLKVMGDIELATFSSLSKKDSEWIKLSLSCDYNDKVSFKITKGKNDNIKKFEDIHIAFASFSLFVTGATELFYIKASDGAVLEGRLNISEVTDYSFKLEKNIFDLKCVNIGELPCYRPEEYYMITSDLELGRKIWNKSWTEKIENLERHLSKIKGYIID